MILPMLAAVSAVTVAQPVVTPPTLLGYAEPAVQDEAGEVVVEISIDVAGEVERVALQRASSARLAAAAMVAATQFRFAPARRDGVAVPAEVAFTFTFTVKPARLQVQVVDQAGEPVAGVDVQVAAHPAARTTDPQGMAVWEALPAGLSTVTLRPTSGGVYQEEIDIAAGVVTDVVLPLPAPQTAAYETVVVGRIRPRVRRHPLQVDTTPTLGRYRLNRRDIEMTPGALEDIARAVQTMPGVVGEPGLLATFFVRGGDVDDTIFYLDGVPLANGFHLGGFVSIFNPEVIDDVEFFAGAQPAIYRGAPGGVLDIGYIQGATDRIDGVVDVSMHTAKAYVSGPVGVEGLTFVLAARRSYFEAYFQALAALGIVGRGLAAPHIGEALAKATYRHERDVVEATLLYAVDGLSFLSRQDDEALITFEGSLRIDNNLGLASLRWRHETATGDVVQTQLAFTHDANTMERRGGAEQAGGLLSSGNASTQTLLLRSDVTTQPAADHTLRFGVDLSWQRAQFAGRVQDTRALPPWAALPMADYGLPTLDIAPQRESTELQVYLEDTWRDALPGLTPRLGLRVALNERGEVLWSPRLAASWSLWPGGALKIGGGLFQQRALDPLQTHPRYGNPELRAEETWLGVFGIEQLLPWQMLVRAEAWFKNEQGLVVAPDTLPAAGQPAQFRNLGSGRSSGFDFLLMHRGEMFGGGLSYGFLDARRENPLLVGYETRYRPLQYQAHTFGVAMDLRLWDQWVFVARYQYHSARPQTPIVDWSLGEVAGAQVWQPTFGEVGPDGRRRLNTGRHGDFHELSLRAEWWLRFTGWRLTLYAEVINVTNATTVYIDSYGSGTIDGATGTPPERGAFETLPIRPFLGLRAEL